MRRNPLVLVAVGLLACTLVGLLCGPHIAQFLTGMARGLRAAGPLGGIFFTCSVLVLSLIGIVPGALLGIAGGAVFGFELGTIYSSIGILAGAYIAFRISRSVLRRYVAAWLHRKGRLTRMNTAVAADGWRMVALLRVSPVMPFSIVSYGFGLSSIACRDYMLGTLASMLPLLGYVALGALGGWGVDLQHPGQMHLVHLFLSIFSACATVALILYATRLMRRMLAV